MYNPNTFGKLIRTKRLDENLTAKSLCEMTGLDRSRLSNIENGMVFSPSIEIITKLSDYMNLTTLELAKKVDFPNSKLKTFIEQKEELING